MSEYEQDMKAKDDELKYLEKTIAKLKRQAESHIFFLAIGVLVCILGVIFFAMNTDMISGSISVIVIGVGVIIYNYLGRKQKLKRAEELNKDYTREKEAKDDSSF